MNNNLLVTIEDLTSITTDQWKLCEMIVVYHPKEDKLEIVKNRNGTLGTYNRTSEET